LVKKEAAQSSFRLLDSYELNTGDLERHLKIHRDFQEIYGESMALLPGTLKL
jgi:hypothetical protein